MTLFIYDIIKYLCIFNFYIFSSFKMFLIINYVDQYFHTLSLYIAYFSLIKQNRFMDKTICMR